MYLRDKERMLRGIGGLLTAALLVACGFVPSPWNKRQKPAVQAVGGLAPADAAVFSARFQKDVWPLLTRNCTGCHTANNPSQLHFTADPAQNFTKLLIDGHFDPENPASLLARVTSPIAQTKMPPAPLKPWTDADIAVLRAFINDLYAKRPHTDTHADEQFPALLLQPFAGKRIASGSDNTFLTYYQLRGKVKAIFDDDWQRDDKDLYSENLAQFGGADFVKSFNESAKPTAQFLSGVDMLSRDVAARAYLTRSGPFAGFAENLPLPLKATYPDPATREQINRLYRRLLFRDATAQEMRETFGFMRQIYGAGKEIAAQDYDLRFELTARDADGLAATKFVRIRVANDPLGLCQTLVNENDNSHLDKDKKIARTTLNGPFTFAANDPNQRVVVSNADTRGNVVVYAVELRGPLPADTTHLIPVTDPAVRPQGAWSLHERNGVACYEDENRSKGSSELTLPVSVAQDGKYEVSLLWRKGDGAQNADNVLVEVESHDATRLAVPTLPPPPPQGQARVTVDESDDTVSSATLKTAFRFGPGDGVEISNAGTRRQVVADAVKFVPEAVSGVKTAALGAMPFLVSAKNADGQADWKDFKKGEYSFFKPVGERVVSDGNDVTKKGKLRLLYRPETDGKAWKPDSYYHVEFFYPGTARNDTDVPILIHARASSPIVRVTYPSHARVGSQITLDASGSYNLQRTPLRFTWKQIGGAQVKASDPHAAKLTFTAPAMTARQAAWEGLCRALMKHPDFLFTRPLSLASTHDPLARKRLQLVKIAQDLVARTPTPAEVAKLEHGASLTSLVNGYLASQEFADFYFRRIRLYLESHGTDEDDEPVRLWCYIMEHNRPFKEILTADYTVDANGNRLPRPAYCGKSGVLSMQGFIKGKPGLPHFNYAAQVCEKFLGYVFEVPPEIVKMRDGITAASTTSPSSVCYSCHKVLTPLAYQRSRWTDDGIYKMRDDGGQLIDDSDHQLVPSYPFKGNGMEAFAEQAQNKERFIRTMIQTHYLFFFGREMRCERDERGFYKRLWDTERANNYSIKGLIRALVTSPEYLNGTTPTAPPSKPKPALRPQHLARR